MGVWRQIFGLNKKRISTEEGKNGEKIFRYPSGYVAAIISRGESNRVSSFFEDSAKGRLLCNFNHQGVGDVFYENGVPRVSVTTKDCTFFDTNGNMKKRWTWPRLLNERVELRLGERLHVTLIDRQHITVKLRLSSKNDKITEFDCGESQQSLQIRQSTNEPERALNRIRTVQKKGRPLAAIYPANEEEEVYLSPISVPRRASSLPAAPLTSPDVTPMAAKAPPQLPPERGLVRSRSEGVPAGHFGPLLKVARPLTGIALAGLLFVASRGNTPTHRGRRHR